MINLKNDYNGLGHEKVLDFLLAHKDEKFVGYGEDDASKEAKALIKKEIKNEFAKIYFTSGGTSTNKIMISHVLKPYEAVCCADTGHINVHETGAIEAEGHKVLTCKNKNGKVVKEELDKIIKTHLDYHMVKPKMLYISNTTECGSVYTYQELSELSRYCKEHDLYFYIDGARLGAALTSSKCDYDMATLATLCDAFYIGGTKNGLLMGEALVVLNDALKDELEYSVKHYGGMLAKGFVTGLSFKALFTDHLFYEIAEGENKLASYFTEQLKDLNVSFLCETESNQLFPIFSKEEVEKLQKSILFEVWEERESETVIRFVTSYQTKKEEIDEAIEIIKNR